MTERVDLELKYADGSPFIHKYYRQPDSAVGLIVTFPGAHYGMDGPLLFYPALWMRQQGWDSLSLAYSFQEVMSEPDLQNIPTVIGECSDLLKAAFESRSYGHITIVGKSLGCGIASYLCSGLDELQDSRLVCLTPPLDTPYFDPVFAETTQAAILAIGTADRFYDEEVLANLKTKRDFALSTFEGCDHSLVLEGDVEGTMRVLAELIQMVSDFAQNGEAN